MLAGDAHTVGRPSEHLLLRGTRGAGSAALPCADRLSARKARRDMNEPEALAALLEAARGPYDCAESFRLSRGVVIALVRGLLSARPALTVAELRELAGRAG